LGVFRAFLVSMFFKRQYIHRKHIYLESLYFNKYNHVSIYTIVQYREDLFRRAYKCFGPHFTYVTRLSTSLAGTNDIVIGDGGFEKSKKLKE
jgi:hypothetical protein